jgi:hypothetical protein
MSDTIDPRVQFFMARMTDDACDDLTILDLAGNLSRQLLPPDARERIAKFLFYYVTPGRDASDWDALGDTFQSDADELLAALSANGYDVAASPEAAAECQTVVTMTMEPGTLTEAKATELAEAFTNYINAVGERDGVTFTVGTPQYVDDGIDEVRFVIGTGKVTGR